MGAVIIGLVVVFILFGLLFKYLFSFLEEDEIPTKNDKAFDDTILGLKNEGCKITYMNRNTGTITYKDPFGETKSVRVYKGYNSHYKDTK